MSHSVVVSAVTLILGIIVGAIALVVAATVLGFVTIAIGKMMSALHAVFYGKPHQRFANPLAPARRHGSG
ncbi:MAG: hypothetical protein ACREQR_16755 [Candidatus Binataceae bacterium]